MGHMSMAEQIASGNDPVHHDPPLRGAQGIAVTEGGRSPTGVTAIPCKLECFGLRSWKSLRAAVARLVYPVARRRGARAKRPVRLAHQEARPIQPSPDFWPEPVICPDRWDLVAWHDEDLLDRDAQRRLKLWLNT
jgi:hypothetical protein